MNLIVDQLTDHGVMSPSLLYDSPFTDLATRGPDDLFAPPELDELIAVIDRIAATAVAA